ncbi:xanthine dehydrogenase family protein molybdopterin-binding subunit [Sphingomonas sp. DT-207]|uniref:xanthine dehydrogenase family protein molybdopterin-binding subunit n=1 Tax=Sphingomonas sp. DT-207 TaxID=3396167 RepID=UPI003F1C726E
MIGKGIDRLDGPAKVSGTARYAHEFAGAGEALVGVLVGATIARGRILATNADAVRAMPGVRLVLTHREMPEQAAFVSNAAPPGQGENRFARPRPFLDSDAVRYWGEPIALVVADSFEQARDAALAFSARYDALPPRTDIDAELDRAYDPKRINNGQPSDSLIGDLDAAIRSGAASLDLHYSTPRQNHNPMEPWATLAVWRDDKLTLYTSTQTASVMRDSVAVTLGLAKDQVRVVSKFVGGGFGGKLVAEADAILAAHAARLLGRPVKVAMLRQQGFSMAAHRPHSRQRIRFATTAEGVFTATGMDVVNDTATFQQFVEQTADPVRSIYAAPNRRTTHRAVALDIPAPDTMRAPGEAPGLTGYECAVDEIAEKLGIDPIELRIRNEPDRHPENGKPFGTRRLVECYREGARRFGWDARRLPRTRREGDWWIGIGMAAAFRPNYLRPCAARAIAHSSGRVTIQTSMTDLGTGSYTIYAQVAAEALGVPLSQVTVELADSALPPSPGSGGSWGAASGGSAVLDACRKLRAMLEPGEIAAAVRKLGGEDVAAEGAMVPGEALQQLASASYGAIFVEAAVDAVTGEVRVRRMLGVFDVGRVLNAKTARSQLIGGMTWGLSIALHEETVIDHRYGLPVNRDLAGYHIPVHADVEEIDAIMLDGVEPGHNPLGVKGVGEVGACGSGAAVANAIYNACGVRVRDMPITLDKIRAGWRRA